MTHKDVTIGGCVFSIDLPYAAGHVINANEAASLNQTRAENIGNNFRGDIAEMRKSLGIAEGPLPAEMVAKLQAELTEYAKTYEFGVTAGRGPRGPSDPIGKAALNLAVADITAAASAKGLKLTAVQIGDLGKAHYEARKEHYRAQAEKNAKKADVDFDVLFAAAAKPDESLAA